MHHKAARKPCVFTPRPVQVDVWRGLVSAAGNGAGRNFRHIMILNGDIDPVVDLHGTEAAVQKLGFPVKKGQVS